MVVISQEQKPVAWRWVWKSKPDDIDGWCYTNTPPLHPDLQLIEPLFTHHASNQLDEIAKVLHYPDCWDVMAYPTLEDAIIEAKSWAHCTNDDCQCQRRRHDERLDKSDNHFGERGCCYRACLLFIQGATDMMTKDEIMKVLDAMNYAISPSGTFWVKKHNEAKQILQAALAEPEGEPATVLRLIDTIKYLVGIAERGEGRKARDDELPEQFVLGYVKRLEAALAEPSEPVATIEISERGTSRTIDTHFAYCVRDWPCGEYELFTHPAKPEPSEPDCSPNHLCNGRMVHLPNGEQCDKCGETP